MLGDLEGGRLVVEAHAPQLPDYDIALTPQLLEAVKVGERTAPEAMPQVYIFGGLALPLDKDSVDCLVLVDRDVVDLVRLRPPKIRQDLLLQLQDPLPWTQLLGLWGLNGRRRRGSVGRLRLHGEK